MIRLRLLLLACLLVASAALRAHAVEATVAVASNFLTTAERLATAFAAVSGHDIRLVHGATGTLYAQIVAGAPFDVFLAADAARPARLVDEGLAEDARTYAFGRLAVVTREPIGPDWRDLLNDRSTRVALADPATAPYGQAAREVLKAIRGPDWQTNVVFGENVGQTFAFVATGNAPIGLVALSQTLESPIEVNAFEVPQDMHGPIKQDAVLLARARSNPAAVAFFAYLASPEARASIVAAGYGVTE